jgi:hypothetical protein
MMDVEHNSSICPEIDMIITKNAPQKSTGSLPQPPHSLIFLQKWISISEKIHFKKSLEHNRSGNVLTKTKCLFHSYFWSFKEISCTSFSLRYPIKFIILGRYSVKFIILGRYSVKYFHLVFFRTHKRSHFSKMVVQPTCLFIWEIWKVGNFSKILQIGRRKILSDV